MKYVAAILVAGVLIGLNAVLLVKNQNTPKPEGCEDLTPDCTACGITDCTMRRSKKEE